MRRLLDGDLISANLEIKRTFHRRQSEERVVYQMANAQNEQVVQVNKDEIIDERNMLVGDFMTPQIIQSQSSIVYQTNNIHLFQNGYQFYDRAEENPHTHIS